VKSAPEFAENRVEREFTAQEDCRDFKVIPQCAMFSPHYEARLCSAGSPHCSSVGALRTLPILNYVSVHRVKLE
jgi:hypothetical protein